MDIDLNIKSYRNKHEKFNELLSFLKKINVKHPFEETRFDKLKKTTLFILQ